MKKFLGEDISTISPTFGFNIRTVEHKGWVRNKATVYTMYTYFLFHFRLNLNIWDVGGQRSLRSYWRNYFECTDGVVWVVDSADRTRMEDCRAELHSLLVQEVHGISLISLNNMSTSSMTALISPEVSWS